MVDHPRSVGRPLSLEVLRRGPRDPSRISRWIAKREVVPRLPDLVREVDEHVLDLRVLLEGVDAQVLPEPALLVPAVRHLAHDRQVVVDLDGPEPERIRSAMRPLHVLRPPGRVQAVYDIVRGLDRLVLVRELLDVDHAPEDLLAANPHR